MPRGSGFDRPKRRILNSLRQRGMILTCPPLWLEDTHLNQVPVLPSETARLPQEPLGAKAYPFVAANGSVIKVKNAKRDPVEP